MGVGTVIGLYWPKIGICLEPLASIFLTLIKSIIAPLLFGTLVSALAGVTREKQVGSLALTTLVYFLILTSIALLFGYAAAVILQPGSGLHVGFSPAHSASLAAQSGPTFWSVIQQMIPSSVVDAMARGSNLQIIVFSLIFGAACGAAGEKGASVGGLAEALSQVMFRYTHYVMYLAPVGVASSMAATLSRHGADVLPSLGKFLFVSCSAELVFVILILFPIAWFLHIPVARFLAAVREPLALAFSTASSDSALPLAMERMQMFGVPRNVVAFVLPAGCTFNLAGTTLFLALASMFLIQVHGASLPKKEQIIMMVTLMLMSKGIAAVPRGSYVVLAAAVSLAGVPAETTGIILGIDSIVDMVRTSVNLLGNCLGTAVVARIHATRF
jgi:proton glutamate symport protein